MALQGETYWLTFRISDDGHYALCHQRLAKAVQAAAEGAVWNEPTSFYLFKSKLSIDGLADHLGASIRPDHDFVLIGMPFQQKARIIGNWQDDRVRRLMSFIVMA